MDSCAFSVFGGRRPLRRSAESGDRPERCWGAARELDTPTRLGVLTTVAACLEGLREAKTGSKAVGPRAIAGAGPAPEGNPRDEKVVAPGRAVVRS